jgi:alkylhydroperoxidase family enzyme
LLRQLEAAVLASPGTLDPAVRRACADGAPPAALAAYVDKVRVAAYKVTDDDVAALRAAGYSEDQIFEATVSAALGANLSRLELALRTLAEPA